MGNKRKPRREIKEKDHDLLQPIDVLSLGSDEDPCFGKLHDLLQSECKSCGDSEFCAIVKAQGLHKERISIETHQRFKDIEEGDQELKQKKEEAKKLITGYREQGLKRLKTIIRVSKELNIPKEVVKQLYDQI